MANQSQQDPRQGEGGKPMDVSIREQLSRGLEERARQDAPVHHATWGEEKGLTVTPAWQRPIAVMFGLVSQAEIVSFFEQIALLLECGMPLLRALNSVHNRWRNPVFQRVIGKMAKTVEQGRSFSEATAEHPRYFPDSLVAMIRAGEKSGHLPQTLERIADQGENILAVRRKAYSIMVYPLLVLVVAMAVVTIVFGVLADGFQYFLENVGMQEPPWAMKVLLKAGNIMRSPLFWVVFVGAIFGIWFLYLFLRKFQTFRLLRDRFLLRCPGVGHFVKQSQLVNFSRVFSTLLSSGVSLEDSLVAVRGTTRNEVLKLNIDRVREAVRRGERMTPVFARGQVFPDLAYDLCGVGEEGGMLDRVFARLADVYDEKQSTELTMVGNLVQPATVIVLGLIVGFILFAFFNMYASAFQSIQSTM